MRINTKVRYGLNALKYIALNSDDSKLVRIKEISTSLNISLQYLEQILFRLKNKGIISGKRGPHGGYKLNKSTRDVSLHEIYIILEDEFKVVNCNETEEHKVVICDISTCGSTCLWSQLDTLLTKILSEASLEDFITNETIVDKYL